MAQDYAEPHYDFEMPGASSPSEMKPFWRQYLSWFAYGCMIGAVIFGWYQWQKHAAKTDASSVTQSFSDLMPRSSSIDGADGAAQRAKTHQQHTHVPTFDFYTILPEGGVGAAASQAPASRVDIAPPVAEAASEMANEMAKMALLPISSPMNTPVKSPSKSPIQSTQNLPTKSAQTAPNKIAVQASQPASQASVLVQSSRRRASQPVTFNAQVASFRSYRDADELRVQLLLQGFEANIQSTTDQHQQSWHRVVIGPLANKSRARSSCAAIKNFGHDCLVLTKRG